MNFKLARSPRFAPIIAIFVTLSVAVTHSHADDFERRAMTLFDGQSLAGWEGDAYWFRIEEGAIVAGRLDEKIPHNQFLCTTERFDDFELRLDAKLVGDGKNAGVQFRSKRVPGSSEVSGYQADAGYSATDSLWGALYDESRRRKMLAMPTPEVSKTLQADQGWNAVRIVCQGPRIQIFVNDKPTIDYTETDDAIPRVGVIGLQIHSGPPSEAWYRNIRILGLPATAVETTPDPKSEQE